MNLAGCLVDQIVNDAYIIACCQPESRVLSIAPTIALRNYKIDLLVREMIAQILSVIGIYVLLNNVQRCY